VTSISPRLSNDSLSAENLSMIRNDARGLSYCRVRLQFRTEEIAFLEEILNVSLSEIVMCVRIYELDTM
jgi:hypothetical protein